jgi:chemotaxis regulatin CheY-phosphate phosphatase CheZ
MTERVWTYIISKELNDDQLKELTERTDKFVNSWTAHEQKLKASFELYKNRILIIKVDESAYNASGCSIDKQLQFIKQIEKDLAVELLNRLVVAYEESSEVKVTHSAKIKELLQQGEINENTLVFDTTISSSVQLPEWKKPLKNTWLSKFLPSYSS